MAGSTRTGEEGSLPELEPFTLVIPTRDDPVLCATLLDDLAVQNASCGMNLQVLFLVNDTGSGSIEALRDTLSEARFAGLRPGLLRAARNYPTVEENIRYTLGENLGAVGDVFLIVGNSDRVQVRALRAAVDFLRAHRLALLLIGAMNLEIYQGKPLRQMYGIPRHLTAKTRMGTDRVVRDDLFSDAMADYGPIDYLAYIGCQIYTKAFFLEVCRVQAGLAEPLYSIPIASLAVSARDRSLVGFFPEVVVLRVDHLQFGPDSAEQQADWWVPRSKTDRGLSNHLFLSVIVNSLSLSDAAFEVMVNARLVAIRRASSQYLFSNFLFNFVSEISEYLRSSDQSAALRYSREELEDIVRFGRRLETVEIGLPQEQRAILAQWLQYFSLVGGYEDRGRIEQLLSASEPLLKMLGSRPGMERWVAQLL